MFIGRGNMSVFGKKLLKKNFRYKICILGGLSIGVPGELRAYKKAYDEFGGGVSWEELFQPTIQLCRDGFNVSSSQAAAIQQTSPVILNDPTMRFIFKNYFIKKKKYKCFLVENFL